MAEDNVTPAEPAVEPAPTAPAPEAVAPVEAPAAAPVEAPAPAAAPASAPAAAAAAPAAPAAPEKEKPKTINDVFLSLDGGATEAPKIVKAKGSKNVSSGIVHVIATFNNTQVSVTDRNGNLIGWSSAGKMGFKGSRKGTAYAGQVVSQDACRQALGHGLREVEVRLKGPGSGRESAVRAVQALNIEITTIKDVTPVPHNGCRPPKARRV
jgi:small subunit ribosomal protein S11